jgi:hypothetical protein
LARGTKLLTAVRHLSAAAAVTLPPAPAGFDALSRLLAAGRVPLKNALPLAGEARGGIQGVDELLPPLAPILPRLDSVIDNSRPLLHEVADHSCDIKNAVASIRSMTGLEQTGNGERGRGMAFRLQLVVPGAEGVGLSGPGVTIKRSGYAPDCTYRSKPYPQFFGDGTAR